ncbi:cell shape-determining protein MreC precursor [mine drainage metagenome]|uniref:Cell shape-determining protein MreC n=1 Tax=mine drainage metagenome TaxID=410659 RepID=A0A1J5QGX6_9ZZZZ
MNRDTRRSRFIFGSLLVLSLLLITIDLRSGSALKGPRSIANSVVSPLQRAATGVAVPIGNFFSEIGSLGSTHQQIQDLRKQNAELKAALVSRTNISGELAQLKGVLDLAGAGRYRTVAGRVIGMGSAAGFAQTITVDVGSANGITPDMTVISTDGLVGRVHSVGTHSCTVILLSDLNFKIGARLAGSEALGIISGEGSQPLSLEILDAQVNVKVGDQLVARGSVGGHPFVPGVPIGVITELSQTPGALTRLAKVRPYAHLGTLDIVGIVVTPPKSDPRDALLPPVPTPTPIPTVTVTVTAAPTITPTTTPSSIPTVKPSN